MKHALVYDVPFPVPYWNRDEFMVMADSLLNGNKGSVSQFEKEFSRRMNVKHAIATNLGRTAIWLALKAMDLKAGDEVILPSFACFAVVQPILEMGCVPVYADITDDLNIDANSIEEQVSEKTKLIIMIHLCGRMADVKHVLSIANDYGLYVLDDASQACGARYNGIFAGASGDAGVFSFGMGKNIMATQGGMLVTDSQEVYHKACAEKLDEQNNKEALKRLANALLEFRFRKFTKFPYLAFRKLLVHNSKLPSPLPQRRKMSALDASLARQQLSKLDLIIQRRVRNARLLTEHLTTVDQIETPIGTYPENIFTKYPIKVSDNTVCQSRDRSTILVKLFDFLGRRGIEAEWLYNPLHLRQDTKRTVALPSTEDLYRRVLCLPVNPFLSERQIEHVAFNVKQFLEKQNVPVTESFKEIFVLANTMYEA
jgi:perosamine synthetase